MGIIFCREVVAGAEGDGVGDRCPKCQNLGRIREVCGGVGFEHYMIVSPVF
jgi:hypothetical protein